MLRLNNFLGTTLFYGFSTAINKGLMLIALPFLGAVLSIEEYGLWTLSQILISLGAPFFSLNAMSGILREGVDNEKAGYATFFRYTQLIVVITLITGIVIFFLPRTWVWYTVVLILVEAFQNSLLGWYRSQDRHINYFFIVLMKLIALIAAVFIIKTSPNIEILLMYQTILGAIFLVPFYLRELLVNKSNGIAIIFKKVLVFSMVLIPHGLAQWVMSGSDRIIIKYLLDDVALGKYSLAYTLAMVLMVVNSGLALTVPNFIIKDYENWILKNRKLKILIGYSLSAIIINWGLVLCIDFFVPFVPLLAQVDHEIKVLMIWLTTGLYFLGIYFFYVNILFYHRKARTISMITIFAAMFNLLGTYIFVEQIGILGAAVTTFASYLLYLLLFAFTAYRTEKRMRSGLKTDGLIVMITGTLNFIALLFI